MTESGKCIIRIPASPSGRFFEYWVAFLKPIHHLTDLECKIFALFLKHRYELSRVIKDDKYLDNITMSSDIRKTILGETGITAKHLTVVIGNLRKKKLIVDGMLNRRFVPNLSEGMTSFHLIIDFSFDD